MNKLISLSESSKNKPKVTVAELIAALQLLPADQEIVIYPKYEEVNGYDRHRFFLDNVTNQEQRDGYKYCAIIF